MPEDAAKQVETLEERIAELKTSISDEDLAEAIGLAEEALAIRLEHQGPDAGWTNDEGEPTEWYELRVARLELEDLRLRASLNLETRAELAEADASMETAVKLWRQGRYDEAHELTRLQLERYREVLSYEHPNVAGCLGILALILDGKGDFAAAEPVSREALALFRKLFGDEHPDVADSLNNLAILLNHRGDYSEAELLYREALAVGRRLKGEESPSIASRLHNLAVLLDNNGDYAAAIKMHRESLAMKRKLLGDEHLEVAISLGSLAGSLELMGEYAEAETLHRKELAMKRKLLGEAHPHIAISLNNLAMLLVSKGDYTAAEQLSRESLALNRKLLGDEHPNVATCLDNLALVLTMRGDYAAAEPLSRESLAMRRKLLDDEHRDVANSLVNLALILQFAGDYAAAEPLIRESLALHRKLLGDEHPDVANSLNNLAWLLQAKGDYAAAEPRYREALAMYRKLLGDEHLQVALTLNNLAWLLQEKGDYTAAEPLYHEALNMRRKLLDDEHPYVVANLGNLAGLLYDKGDYLAAEKDWKTAAERFEVARLRAGFSGLERVQFTALRSPLKSLAACQARNGKPLPAWISLEADLARGLFDTMSAREARPLGISEQNREHVLIGRLNKIDERISASLRRTESTDDTRKRLDELHKERETLQAELARFEAEMAGKYGVATGEVYEFTRIQSRLSADEALLVWVDKKGDPRAADPNGDHWACVVKKQGDPIWVRLPGSGKNGTWTEKDDQLAQLARTELSRRVPGTSTHWRDRLLRQLYDQRIMPVEPHLDGVRHLIVLPAGKMSGIPVEVLTNAYTVSYAPSGTMYAWLREKSIEKDQLDHEEPDFLLALGDPVFQKSVAPAKPLPKPPDHGVLVAMVAPESNAMSSGLRQGDVLLIYGGTKLDGPEELGPAIRQAQEMAEGQAPGAVEGVENNSKIPVTVWRSGEIHEITVTPGRLGVRSAPQPVPEAILTQRRLDEVMVSTRGPSFDPIPYTRHEVQAIYGLFEQQTAMVETEKQEDTSLTLLGSEASEQRLDAMAVSGELEKYRYLHLATHGVMDDKIAMNSAMILSQDSLHDAFENAVAGSEVYDGRLTAAQIVRTWKLDADLVSLSGCETGLGKESGGEGFLGFSQALFVAGARSLMLSLWKVDDRATMLLMTRFYENLLGKYEEVRRIRDIVYKPGTPISKAEALLEAKIWLRQLTAAQIKELRTNYRGQSVAEVSLRPENVARPEAHHPYEDPRYWASFILIGNPD